MSQELTELSASRMAEMVRRREVSPVELIEAHLSRIESLNKSLNAIVTLSSNALECAREAEAAIMRGDSSGALCGVPLTIKDTIDVGGMRTTAGSKVRAGHVPRGDATAVARLRSAGAIILGKTNTSELALNYSADNPVFGRTNNPYDESRTAGGSSGGCATAVAAGLSAGSVGSDLAGSIRIPAHFCGIVGFKPTSGRIPSAGHFPPVAGPYSLAASLGPLTRNVEDAALLYEVLSGRKINLSEGGSGSKDNRSNTTAAYFTDDGTAPVTNETEAAVERAAKALSAAGIVTRPGRPPGFEGVTELWLRLFSHETRRVVCSTYRSREAEAGAAAKLILDSAQCSTPQTIDDFFNAWTERDDARSHLLEWMETTPLVVAPVGAVAAFRHDDGHRFNVGGKRFGLFRAFGYAHACNVFDLPVVCVPAGRTREGLPIGVQIIGRPFEEEQVLRAARIVEEALGPTDTLGLRMRLEAATYGSE